MKRTEQEIREAIIAACGDAADNEDVRELRDKLIKKAIWYECAPPEGWYRAAKKRLEILDAMPEPEKTGFMDDVFGDNPRLLAAEICKAIDEGRPINIKVTDDYIEDKTGKRP